MIRRHALDRLLAAVDRHAAVALLGARQVGKTTLALAVAETRESVYLDLEAPSDRAKLEAPEASSAARAAPRSTSWSSSPAVTGSPSK